jgi:hydrogenase nickel incorporation protein HypA/HybF
MHEVAIMTEAVRIAVEAAQAAGAGRITRLRLRVGVLSGVVPEAMRFAFDVVCGDTMAAGAQLEIELVTGRCWCATCHAEFGCANYAGQCPCCHNVSNDLRSGRELYIADVEIE